VYKGQVGDEIANSEEAIGDEEERQASIHQQLEAAQKKAGSQGGTNPLLIVAALGAVAFLAYAFLVPQNKAMVVKEEKVDLNEISISVDVSCLGEDDCMEKARTAYKVGEEFYEKKEVHVSNLFESFRKMVEVEAYLEQAGQATPPPELAKASEFRDRSKSELVELFRNYRAAYTTYRQRKMGEQMLDALNAIRSYFPEKTSPQFKWASDMEVEMKASGLYPEPGRR